MPTWNEIPRLYTQLIGNPITGFNNLGVNLDYNTIKLRQGTQWDWRAYLGAPWTSYGQANSTNKEWECWVIGGTWMSPYNQESYYTAPGNPIYYYTPDIRDEGDFQLFLREIPWNIENYDYDDATKISQIIVEMMQHGWRFKKRDGSAPIAVDVLLAYDFTDPNFINEGDSTVTDLSNGNGTGHGSGFKGDLNQNAALASGAGTFWTNAPGLDFTSGNQWINVPGNLQPSVQNNLLELIINSAEKNKLPFQRGAASRATGTDTDAFAFATGGVASALISLPLRYMHTTVEAVSKDDVENVIRLIFNSLQKIKNNHDFRYLK